MEAGSPEQLSELFDKESIDLVALTPITLDQVLFHREKMYEEKLQLVVPDLLYDALKQAAEGDTLPASVLDGIPFIMPPRHDYINWVIRAMADTCGAHLNVVMVAGGPNIMMEMVKRGVGATVLSTTFIPGFPNVPGAKCYNITEYSVPTPLWLAYPKNHEINPDGQTFIAIMREELPRMQQDEKLLL